MSDFAKRLTDLMNAKGVSAYRLHKDLQIPQSSISNYRKGKSVPAPIVMAAIADYLQVTVNYLRKGEELDAADTEAMVRHAMTTYYKEFNFGPDDAVIYTLKDDSMDSQAFDKFPEGTVVLYKKVDPNYYLHLPLNITNWPYWVIILKNSQKTIFRRITKHDLKNQTITCQALSHSPEYQDFELPFDQIESLNFVVEFRRRIAPVDYTIKIQPFPME